MAGLAHVRYERSPQPTHKMRPASRMAKAREPVRPEYRSGDNYREFQAPHVYSAAEIKR